MLITFSLYSQDQIIEYYDLNTIHSNIREFELNEEYGKAIKEIEKISVNDTSYTSRQLTLSYYLIQDAQYEDALTIVNRNITKADPELEVSFAINKSVCLRNLEEYQKANEFVDTYIEKYPKSFSFYVEKGRNLLSMGNKIEAINNFEKALVLNPTNDEALLFLATIYYDEGRSAQSCLYYTLYSLSHADTEEGNKLFYSLNENFGKANLNTRNTGIALDDNDKTFEDLDLLIENKTALQKDYKFPYRRYENLFLRQLNLVMDYLPYLELKEGITKDIVETFKSVEDNGNRELLMKLFSINTSDQRLKNYILRDIDNVGAFYMQFMEDYTNSISTFLNEENKKLQYFYDDNFNVIGYGEVVEDLPIGQWTYIYPFGGILSTGNYQSNAEKSGEWRWYYPNGNIKEITNYEDDMANGESKFYLDNGRLRSIGNYKSDKQTGKFTFYSKNGAKSNIENYEDGKPNGEYVEFFPTIPLSLQSRYYFKDGNLKDTTFTSYFIDSTIFKTMEIKNSTIHGKSLEYFENGTLSFMTMYEDGQKNGSVESYYQNGSLDYSGNYKHDNLVGEYKTYFASGQLKSIENFNSDGDSDGNQTEYYTSGEVKNEQEWKDGVLKSYVNYSKNGEILSQGKLKRSLNFQLHSSDNKVIYEGKLDKDGLKKGTWTSYFPNGSLKSTVNYVDNKLNGKVTNYYKSGKISSSYTMINDTIHGLHTGYYDNGQISNIGYYNKGNLENKWITYYKDGSLESQLFYHNSKQNGIQKYFAVNGKLDYDTYFELGQDKYSIRYDSIGNKIDSIYLDCGSQPTYVEMYYSNKIKSMEYKLLYGEIQGTLKQYYPNGNIKMTKQYKGGINHGKSFYYYPNGQLHHEEFYVNGKENDLFKEYYNDGELRRTYHLLNGVLDGAYINYTREGIEEIKVNYVNGLKHGPEKISSLNGEYQLTRYYDNDQLTSYSYKGKDGQEIEPIPLMHQSGKLTAYFQNGQISREMSFVNGELDGDYKSYYSTGQLESEVSFNVGSKIGEDKSYYENGQLLSIDNYQDNLLSGNSEYYYENGSLRTKTQYRNGVKHGIYEEYDLDGNLIIKLKYYNGEPIEILN